MKLPGRPLRYRLFLLAASGLLPLAIVAGVVLSYLSGERERDAQTAAMAVSRALASAVDGELDATVAIVHTLGLSDELAPDRLSQFQALARRVCERQGWRTITVANANGRLLQSVMSSGDTPALRAPVERESLERVIATGRPVVGTVAVGPLRQGPAFAVRVPVERDGRLAFVLSAVVPVERIMAVVQRQKLPVTSVVAVYDQQLNRVARSRTNASPRPSPSLQALLERGDSEGVGPTYTLEGVRSQTGFVRLPGSGWVVATGISLENAERGMYGVLGAVAAGLLASLGLAALMAWYFARDVTEPIDKLKAAAGALGRGEPVHVTHLGIAELEEVAGTLHLASAERDRAAQERLAAEAEREQLLARVTEALHSAEEAARSKDEFLAMLGHELRNPLAPMATALHLMARKGDPATRTEREVMERQVAHMKRLVDDLLDVSRITGKRLEMRMQPLRVADLVQQAAQAVQPVLGARRLQVDIAPDAAGLWIRGDEVRIAQVLANLLGNAIKFTAPQGSIALRLRSVDDAAEITVRDDGVGMPPQVLQHVFDLFYQAPQGTDRARGGLGLGLAIVRSLVEMHGGTVAVTSEGPGRGSCFVVRLPTVVPPVATAAASADGTQADGKGRVLLVDDNQDAADTSAAVLELSGYEVKTAYDPGVALALLDTFAPQVAVLDIGLPGFSGYELAQRLRAHPNGRGCQLVALTGYGTAADVAKAREAGFRQHLVKPAGPDALLRAVQEGIDAEST